MTDCPCNCHGRFQAPCTIEGGCGHLHTNAHQNGFAERPRNACILCQPPWRIVESGHLTCEPCSDKIAHNLVEIGERYARLNPAPGGSGQDGTPGAPGFVSKPTGSLHIMAMRDPRSSSVAHVWIAADRRVHQEPTNPPLSVLGVLETEAFNVAELRGYTEEPPATVGELVAWLDKQLDWLTRQNWVPEFAANLRKLRAQLRPVTGDPRIWIATCPNTIDDGEHTHECPGNLYAPPDAGDTIQCGTCQRYWRREEWESLGQLARDKRVAV